MLFNFINYATGRLDPGYKGKPRRRNIVSPILLPETARAADIAASDEASDFREGPFSDDGPRAPVDDSANPAC
jgi:hypothetical protein